MNIIKSIRSNIGFIITLVILAIIMFNPKAKSLFMTGLVSTGLFNADVSDSHPETPRAAGTPSTLPVVTSALFTSSEGITTNLASLRGKAIFLNFWTTWCPPCIAEMPSVNRLHSKLKHNSNIVFMLADADGNLEKSTAFMKKKKFDLPVYIPASSVPEQLFRGSLPTTVIINKRGEIVFSHEGMANYDTPEMEKFLKELAE
ncbi:MAG TPA: TlpA disulfide reductase family protein [Daejeonella sp.]|nr:TlpA disulfide reductase family protein [Daejeonella sp.]